MDSFKTKKTLAVQGNNYAIHSLRALEKQGHAVESLPYSLKIILENLLRNEDGENVTKSTIEGLLRWDAKAEPKAEIAFSPGRVLLQDFTGVPAVVDLAAMRDAVVRLKGDAKKINPLEPVELVIDHSVQVDVAGTDSALSQNMKIEFDRDKERYQFLKWGQKAFSNFKVVPPSMGIVHQVNLEYLARVVMTKSTPEETWAYPDTLVGTDSHTTMVNGLGVLGWGVGGIEAEACMLGQPTSMLIPQVVGFRLTGKMNPGATATDLVLTVTQMLRKKGVVGKFVEFFGEGIQSLSLADRATIANMAPEYGATCGIFPIDEKTLAYLRLTSRDADRIALVEAYAREQGIFFDPKAPAPRYTDTLELDLASVEPSLAGPKRPQDRLTLSAMKSSVAQSIEQRPKDAKTTVTVRGKTETLRHGSVVIAAITSCTNTSNPNVLLAAGILAKKAVDRGLSVPAHVKTSLAPGSRVVTEYLDASGLSASLDRLGFQTVGYGCTTCIGNSGPLDPAIVQGIDGQDLVVASVLSGNRNFEGRVHAKARINYLASPPLVVAYALAGTTDIDLSSEPLAQDPSGKPVYLRDVWPTPEEIEKAATVITSEMFSRIYAGVFDGDTMWREIPAKISQTYDWDRDSTYIQHPPYFEHTTLDVPAGREIKGARALAVLGDSITTDHISPAGNTRATGAAGLYLQKLGVSPDDFNSYGARRGNHEVMKRGTFANIRLKNLMLPGVERPETLHVPSKARMSIFDASEKYASEGTPLVILAGKEYGSGSSRDWAAKGPRLLGIRAVIAESFERIHRSNLVGMGILPLQFKPGESFASLGLTGLETFDFIGVATAIENYKKGQTLRVIAKGDKTVEFEAVLRIDTPMEAVYYRNDGILTYVLRQIVKKG